MKKVFITIVFLMFCNILVLAETENVKSANDITESQVDENLSHKAKVEKVSAEAGKLMHLKASCMNMETF